MKLLEQERFISALPPLVYGGMVVIPHGLLLSHKPDPKLTNTGVAGYMGFQRLSCLAARPNSKVDDFRINITRL